MWQWYAIGAAAAMVYFALCAWLVIEAFTAPLVNEESGMIFDPYGRLSHGHSGHQDGQRNLSDGTLDTSRPRART